MPEIKRTFNRGKMNRDLDDRIVPPGEYREAFNANIGQSEASDVGAIENLLGNELAANCSITNAKCIGVVSDSKTEKIYFFVTNNSIYNETNNGQHGLFEYDQKTKQTTALIVTSQLNLHQNYPITGINIVDDLLFWTDNRNCPRKINVVTARTNTTYYGSAPDIDNLISVAKFAPYESATLVTATKESSITSTFMEDKLIRFSYRWQFDDSEYSTLAPFTPVIFSRLTETDTISVSLGNFGEIETFVNAINQVQLQIPTPVNYGITSVELIYQEAGNGTLYVVSDKEVTTEPFVNFTYSSTDPFRTLPPDQLTRVYDAVPKKALAQDVAGGRLVYGNFLQNFNIPQIAFTVTPTSETSARNGILENQSVKSRRTYQVGIVLADKFGRQSPVILSSSGVDTVFIDPGYGNASSTTAFNALRITFTDTTQIPDWAYSYRVVVKQREQEYYNWISVITGANNIERLGDSINKIPRDPTATIPPSTSSTISPCNVSVYPKYVNGGNVYSSPYNALTSVQSIANPSGDALVTTIDNSGASVSSGLVVYETEPVSSELDIFFETSTGGRVLNDDGSSAIPATAIDINFFNCILLTFDPGGVGDDHIEINRIRAGYNEPAFNVGVRAYVVQENFTEERRNNTLIHSSGLLNSRTGINYINQFNEAEGGLTISLDPQDGSIQKLFTDDTSINVFQEDKVSRSPINKDFIYSAEGGAVPVTSNTQFLGTVAPFAGQYGIAKDPQSFATFGFSKYFTDKNRGVVLRLSQNGIQEISTVGLGDFFRDALKASDQVIGSYDEYSRLYELTIIGSGLDGNKDTNVATASQGYLTACFDDRSNGWTSFRGFKQEGGLSLNNSYYTFSGGSLWQHHSPNVTRNNFYNSGTQESYVIPVFNDAPSLVKQFNTLAYEGDSGWELSYVETDISNIGSIPTTATTFDTTLQLNGAAPNSIFNGANTSTNKQNEQIFWAIFVSPLNSQFKFSNVTNVTLTPAAGSTLSVTNPSTITDGQLVFQVSHVVGSSNSIQTLDIGGTGAELAFTVALLTVNTIDTISNSNITPASQIFNTSGSNNIQFTAVAFSNYYVDNNNIVINTSGMPASTSIGSATAIQSGDNVNYEIPVTVPTTATAGTITVTGSATLKPTLIWTAISFGSDPGFFNTPAGTAAGTAYYISPFDNPNLRLATIVYTCTDTQVLTTSSQTVSYNVGGVTITPALSSNDGILTFSVQLPNLTVNTIATATLGTYTPITATLGSIPATANLVTAGTAITISNTWNVQISVTPADNGGFGTGWIKFNGVNGTAVVNPGDSFTISADANGTGSLRTVDANIACLNTRIQGGSSPLAGQTITITQA
tara:strand:- start:2066 stop:6088 length:4023 start_codon:yes stop_codon:yes gene_type:complete